MAARLLPALDWLGHYRRAWLRGDLVAALTTWALVVPQAIAYAQIAQLPPQAGLFAAFAGLLGVSKGEGDFFPQLWHLLTRLGDVGGWTAAVGLGSLALLLGLKRVAPGIPAALLVVAASIVVVALGDLAGHGVDVIGEIEGAVPIPALPSVGWDELLALLPGALAIAIIGYAETATVGESLADEHGYSIQPDRELTATGLANVLAGLFQGFIAGGGASQSAANDRAGAPHPAGVAGGVGADGADRGGPASSSSAASPCGWPTPGPRSRTCSAAAAWPRPSAKPGSTAALPTPSPTPAPPCAPERPATTWSRGGCGRRTPAPCGSSAPAPRRR